MKRGFLAWSLWLQICLVFHGKLLTEDQLHNTHGIQHQLRSGLFKALLVLYTTSRVFDKNSERLLNSDPPGYPPQNLESSTPSSIIETVLGCHLRIRQYRFPCWLFGYVRVVMLLMLGTVTPSYPFRTMDQSSKDDCTYVKDMLMIFYVSSRQTTQVHKTSCPELGFYVSHFSYIYMQRPE